MHCPNNDIASLTMLLLIISKKGTAVIQEYWRHIRKLVRQDEEKGVKKIT